ncbi:hypothetical protein Q7P35_009378 [Cladosporium inversicolor]
MPPPPTRPATKPHASRSIITPTGAATTRPRSPETHASLALRNQAAEILQSYEQLSWYALDRNESLSQTRLHFLSLLSGFTPADEAAQVDWKTDTSPHAGLGALPISIYTGLEPLGGEGRRKSSVGGKGKERASVGGSGRASPRTSLGGEGSGSARKKKRRSEVGS